MTPREVEILRELIDDIRENPRPVWLYEDVLSAIESAIEPPPGEEERDRMERFMRRAEQAASSASVPASDAGQGRP